MIHIFFMVFGNALQFSSVSFHPFNCRLIRLAQLRNLFKQHLTQKLQVGGLWLAIGVEKLKITLLPIFLLAWLVDRFND